MLRIKVASEDDRRRVISFSQDLIHGVTHGCVKTPKHVALPMAVKHLTGSTQVINSLNRFGNGLSATQLSEVETGMAEKLVQQQTQHGDVFVPSNINPSMFATFCWDNNDINEETLSGAGTTHCTNGIVIQHQAKVQELSLTSIADTPQLEPQPAAPGQR